MAAKKKKKKRRQVRTSRQRLLQTHARRFLPELPPNSEIRIEPKGQAKMSAVLEDFVEPYVDEIDDTIESQTKLIYLAALAWNATFLPEEEREKMLDDSVETLLKGAPAEEKQAFHAIIDGMIERKMAHFAKYKRAIIDFELTDMGTSYHLTVISTMAKS